MAAGPFSTAANTACAHDLCAQPVGNSGNRQNQHPYSRALLGPCDFAVVQMADINCIVLIPIENPKQSPPVQEVSPMGLSTFGST